MAILIGIMAISFGSILAKLAQAPSLLTAAYRLTSAVLVMTPFVFYKALLDFKKLRPRDLGWTVLSGGFLALHFAAWISSLKYISVSSSVVLVALQPVFVALGSWLLLKESIPCKAVLTGSIAMIGTIIIGLGDMQLGREALWGDFLATAGALFAALYWMVGRRVRQNLSVSIYTYLVYGSAAFFLLSLAIVQGLPLFNYLAGEWLLFLTAGIVPTLGGHSLFNWALAYLPSFVVSVAVLGEAIGATILAFLLLGEIPTHAQLLGGCFILLGLYLFLKETARG